MSGDALLSSVSSRISRGNGYTAIFDGLRAGVTVRNFVDSIRDTMNYEHTAYGEKRSVRAEHF